MRRSAPAAQVLVSRFDHWRGFIVALAFGALISLASWLIFSGAQFSPVALVAVVAGTLLVCGSALLALRIPATSMRWDGQHWYAGPAHLVGSEPWAVDVRVRMWCYT